MNIWSEPSFKFVNVNESTCSFIFHEDGKSSDRKIPPHKLITSCEPFTSMSSYRIDFTPKPLSDNFANKTVVYYTPSGNPLKSVTSYRENYMVLIQKNNLIHVE